MMRIAVLSSGSKGNSTLIETNNTKILIDLGVTKSYAEEKLRELEVDPKDISAILISHTHIDHIQGLKVFLKKYHPTIYLTNKLRLLLDEYISDYKYEIYDNYKATIGDIDVNIIKTSHDAGESVGFIIKNEDKQLVHITDTGYINNKYFDMLSNKDLYLMESNHDIEMLMNGKYPFHLRKRILGDKGHLSNDDASYYLSLFAGPKTKNIILAHLSDDNNTAKKAHDKVIEVLKSKNKKCNIMVAKQKERTDFIEI